MEHAQAACQRNAEVIAILMEIADVARRLADKLADLDKKDDCEGGKAYEQDGRLGCRHCRTAQMRRSHYLVDFTRTMIDLGNSTNIVAEDAASTLAKFANITSMDQAQFGNLGATLVDLGNNFATTEADIMNMSLRLAAAGDQVGLSEAQILGFAAALSSVGVRAEMGGSAFSKALINMEVAAATGGQALEDFARVSGMTAEQFKTLWDSDPAAAFQAFIVGLAQMDEEGIGFLKTLKSTKVPIADFMPQLWNALVEKATVNADGSMIFTFRNGVEIRQKA